LSSRKEETSRMNSLAAPAPFVSRVMTVDPAWTDYNGHMNMAYYNVLFDQCADEVYTALGIGLAYVEARRLTMYTAEIHVCYVRELHEGEEVTVTFHLLDHDQKRLHVYQEIHHADGWLAATSESLNLHIDMSGPKVAPFPADILPGIQAFRAAHAGLPTPERAGRRVGIVRKG
jgi:acyl-CoA thioester hydrolase